eukprot:6141338-Amphidinium_carterae.1
MKKPITRPYTVREQGYKRERRIKWQLTLLDLIAIGPKPVVRLLVTTGMVKPIMKCPLCKRHS